MSSKTVKRAGIFAVVAAAVAGAVVGVSSGSADGTPEAAGWRTPVKEWGVEYDASHVYLQHGTQPAFIKSKDRTSVILQFPGGYIAEVHDGTFH